jgi:hypothetical protein
MKIQSVKCFLHCENFHLELCEKIDPFKLATGKRIEIYSLDDMLEFTERNPSFSMIRDKFDDFS